MKTLLFCIQSIFVNIYPIFNLILHLPTLNSLPLSGLTFKLTNPKLPAVNDVCCAQGHGARHWTAVLAQSAWQLLG